jgi:hypothetical protein
MARATQTKLDEMAEYVSWAKRSGPSTEDVAYVESIMADLANARRSLATLDVDIEDLDDRLSQIRAELEKVAQRSLQKNIDASQHAITSFEQRKVGCEHSIEQLKQTMQMTSGAGMGWAFAFLFFLGTVVLIAASIDVRAHENVPVLVIIPAMIIGAVIGSSMSRRRKNRPHQMKIEEIARSVDECVTTIPSLKQRAEHWKQELRSFGDWQAQRPVVPGRKTEDGQARTAPVL